MRRDNTAGRVFGIIVFLAGIGILISVAVFTYRLFTLSSGIMPASPAPGSAVPSSALGAAAITMFYQIGLLIVLAVVGSLIAARGLHLYFVSTGSTYEPEPTSRRRQTRDEDKTP